MDRSMLAEFVEVRKMERIWRVKEKIYFLFKICFIFRVLEVILHRDKFVFKFFKIRWVEKYEAGENSNTLHILYT